MLKSIKYKIGEQMSLEDALNFSLSLAARGLGLVEPNPCVGSVLFNEATNELVAFGHHQKFGGNHAEVNCLKDVESAEGLTLIVTLEPCSHFGKTPPCADLVVEKKIKKLLYITKDPNPLVAGKGLLKIKEAGIEVVQADDKYNLKNRKINHKFFYAFENKKTYVHLKWAESADGMTAVTEGSSWITDEKSREHSHFLRAQSQAVLIGRGTLEKDDPTLNVRKEGYEKKLKVIVFDPDLKSLKGIGTKNVCKVRSEKDIIFLCAKIPEGYEEYSFLKLHKSLKNNGDQDLGREWNLDRLTRDLYQEYGFQSVFVEGGAYTISQFLKQKVANKVSIYKAKHDLGAKGASPVNFFDAKTFKNESVDELDVSLNDGFNEYFLTD